MKVNSNAGKAFNIYSEILIYTKDETKEDTIDILKKLRSFIDIALDAI